MDVHPPLYYFLIHFVSSLFPLTFSKWIGLSINTLFFALTLIVFYKLIVNIFQNKFIADIGISLYGLSSIAISNFILIRMYVLVTFFTVLLMFSIERLIMSKKRYILLYVSVFASIFLGVFSQYFFIFYAFFLCLAYELYLFIKKDFKKAVIFALPALLGIALFILVWPSCFNHLFADKLVSGNTALDNITNPTIYFERALGYSKPIVKSMLVIIATFVFSISMLIIAKIKKQATSLNIKTDNSVCVSLLLSLPSIPTILLVIVISPVIGLRYIYNTIPAVVVLVLLLLYLVKRSYKQIHINHILIIIMIIVSSIASVFVFNPDYTYFKHTTEFTSLVDNYTDSPVVYINNNQNSSLTQDALQLMKFDDFFVTNDTQSFKMEEYINSHKNNESLIVFIDVNKTYSSGYDEEQVAMDIISNTDYNTYEHLYSYGLSCVYVFTK